MAKLKHSDWQQIRTWFSPSPGYVLDFSNRTFAEFFEDEFQVNIYSDAFSAEGTSKFNRLKCFIEISPPHVVAHLLTLLWNRRNADRDLHIEQQQDSRVSQAYDANYLVALLDMAATADASFSALLERIGSSRHDGTIKAFLAVSTEWTLDTVVRDIERAIKSIETDPEAALTAASSMIESICTSIIVARGENLPNSKDIQSLFKEAQRILDLSPKREIQDRLIESDVKMILSSITGVVQGIGALRTHGGSAHGRKFGFRRVDARIARLSVNASCAVSYFLVETWQKRYPEDRLRIATAPSDGELG